MSYPLTEADLYNSVILVQNAKYYYIGNYKIIFFKLYISDLDLQVTTKQNPKAKRKQISLISI